MEARAYLTIKYDNELKWVDNVANNIIDFYLDAEINQVRKKRKSGSLTDYLFDLTTPKGLSPRQKQSIKTDGKYYNLTSIEEIKSIHVDNIVVKFKGFCRWKNEYTMQLPIEFIERLKSVDTESEPLGREVLLNGILMEYWWWKRETFNEDGLNPYDVVVSNYNWWFGFNARIWGAESDCSDAAYTLSYMHEDNRYTKSVYDYDFKLGIEIRKLPKDFNHTYDVGDILYLNKTASRLLESMYQAYKESNETDRRFDVSTIKYYNGSPYNAFKNTDDEKAVYHLIVEKIKNHFYTLDFSYVNIKVQAETK